LLRTSPRLLCWRHPEFPFHVPKAPVQVPLGRWVIGAVIGALLRCPPPRLTPGAFSRNPDEWLEKLSVREFQRSSMTLPAV
jgi:hypothetical protein